MKMYTKLKFKVNSVKIMILYDLLNIKSHEKFGLVSICYLWHKPGFCDFLLSAEAISDKDPFTPRIVENAERRSRSYRRIII